MDAGYPPPTPVPTPSPVPTITPTPIERLTEMTDGSELAATGFGGGELFWIALALLMLGIALYAWAKKREYDKWHD